MGGLVIVRPVLVALDPEEVTALAEEFRALVQPWGLHDFASAYPRITALLQDLDLSQREPG